MESLVSASSSNVWFGRAKLELPVIEQMELHAYFAPMRELTDAEAIAFRKQATIERPYLPSRAGKVWAKAVMLLDHPPMRAPTEIRKKGQRVPPRSPESRVIVKALVRPEIDTKRIAEILVNLARADADPGAFQQN